MNILFVAPYSKAITSSSHRYDVICDAICRDRKHNAEVILSDPILGLINEGPILQADVLILHGDVLTSLYKLIQKWKASGKVVIADLCKPVWFDEMGSKKWIEGDTGSFTRELFTQIQDSTNAQSFRWGIRLVDAVVSNSRRMIEDWGGKSTMYFLPDFLPLDEYLIHPPEIHKGVVVGLKLAGNSVHKTQMTGLFEAIGRIGREAPEAKFLICGDSLELYRGIDLDPNQKMYVPLCDKAEWQKVLAAIDIGVIPLSGVEDDRTGWLDALEYMAMKIPWVASENEALYDLRQYGWLVKNHSSLWERVLLDMIGNLRAYHDDTAGEPYLFAISNGVDEYIDKLYNIIMAAQDPARKQEMAINDTSN